MRLLHRQIAHASGNPGPENQVLVISKWGPIRWRPRVLTTQGRAAFQVCINPHNARSGPVPAFTACLIDGGL
jgi:hypothetical protein